MKLSIVTPLAVVVDEDDVVHVRAEDATGAFGVLDGHADFLTAPTISVVTWRDRGGAEHHVAVRGGMLRVRGGDTVEIATSEAVRGDDLASLERDVLTEFRRRAEDEQAARTDAARLRLIALRRIHRLLRPAEPPAGPGRLDA